MRFANTEQQEALHALSQAVAAEAQAPLKKTRKHKYASACHFGRKPVAVETQPSDPNLPGHTMIEVHSMICAETGVTQHLEQCRQQIQERKNQDKKHVKKNSKGVKQKTT